MRTDCRCWYLALTYIPVKKYAEALTFTQRSGIYLREARSVLSMLGADPMIGDPAFFPLAGEDLGPLNKERAEDNDRFKNDWSTYDPGSPSADNKDRKKPLFLSVHVQERERKPIPILMSLTLRSSRLPRCARQKNRGRVEHASRRLVGKAVNLVRAMHDCERRG